MTSMIPNGPQTIWSLFNALPLPLSACVVQQLRDLPSAGAARPGGDHGEEATGGGVRLGTGWRSVCTGSGRCAQAGGHLLHNEGSGVQYVETPTGTPWYDGCVIYQWYTCDTRPSFIRFVFQGGAGKNELQELETLQDRPFNHIYWSPMGNICLLAAMGDDVGPHNGRLEVRCFNFLP